ncbi:hypothetical protein FRC00_004850 [Tulasnella sp. 408]|nr:hypothetical protein FRC00_004850 [Tulasnella sp. 408]
MRTLVVHSNAGILPNLRTVRWNVNHLGLNHILAFCPPSLERMSLQIRTEAATVDELKRLLSSLASSLINRLKFFEFRADFFPDDNALLSTALNSFIKNQPNLLELQLPSYCIRNQAIASQAYHVPPQLRSFCGELVDTTRQMLRMALDELIRSAPSLRRIVLVRSGNDFAGETLRLVDFTPLLQLSEVDDIKLCGEFQLHLEPQEIQKMGQAWTGLASLVLDSGAGPGIPLSRLVTFAESFPVLEQFAATLDMSGEIPLATDIQSRFKSLQRLLFLEAEIPADRTSRIAEFLAMVCGPGIKVGMSFSPLVWEEVLSGHWSWEVGAGTKIREVQGWMDAFYRVQESILRMQELGMFSMGGVLGPIKEIPLELMRMVFAMSDKLVCARAALVCRRWCSAALDELWRSLPSLFPLFKILGPLVDVGEDGHDLDPDLAISAQSWDLFRSYAARVRCLTYRDEVYKTAISTGLIMRALVGHPGGGILPNLREVHWHISGSGFTQAPAFCPPSLEQVSLNIMDEYVSVDSVKRFLYGLSSSLANRLKSFRLETGFEPTENAALSTALNTLLKNQSGLLELKFPYYQIQDPATITEVCRASTHLRTFCGEVQNFTKEMFRSCLSALAERGTSLRCIWLSRSGSPFEEETICLADIEPMLQLPVVEDIRLWTECKLELEARDIQHMGQAWKGLKSLILCPSQGHGIPLPHLVTFAQWFPALQHFTAPFDCSEYIPTADKVSWRFKSLRRLTLLDVWIHDDIRWMAEFLAMVCGPEVKITIREYNLGSEEILDDEAFSETRWPGAENEALRERMDAFYRVQESIKRMG